MSSYAAILRSYGADADKRAAEDAWWADPGLSVPATIARACRSEVPGKRRLVRHGHQCRLSSTVLQEAAAIFGGMADEVATSRSFDELHDLVRGTCRTLDGAGELYAYDVAQRIGLRLGLCPEHVYLHSGTREGARNLGIEVTGRGFITMNELPPPMRVLTPSEAEDVLCIYKGYLGQAELEDDTDIEPANGCAERVKRVRRC